MNFKLHPQSATVVFLITSLFFLLLTGKTEVTAQENLHSYNLSCIKVTLNSGDSIGGYARGTDKNDNLYLEVESGIVTVQANKINSIERLPYNASDFNAALLDLSYQSIDNITPELEGVQITANYSAGEYDKFPLNITWNSDIDSAKNEARLLNKRIMVKFSDQSEASKNFNQNILKVAEIEKNLLLNFITVLIEQTYNEAYARSIGITEFPYLVFLNSDGDSITSAPASNMTEHEFSDLIKKVITDESFPEHTLLIKNNKTHAAPQVEPENTTTTSTKTKKVSPKKLITGIMSLSLISFVIVFLGIIIFIIVITERAKRGSKKDKSKIRKQQDTARNKGWRIQHIPWQADGEIEIVPNNQISTIMGFGGMFIFLASWVLLFLNLVSAPLGVGIALSSLLCMLLSRIALAYTLYKNWVKIDARCTDIDIEVFEELVQSTNRPNHRVKRWYFRVICEFYYNGQTYKVTPNIAKISGFISEKQILKYIKKVIQIDKHCELWIDPENPLHAILHKKPLTA